MDIPHWQDKNGALQGVVFGGYVATGTAVGDSCVIELKSLTKRVQLLHMLDDVAAIDLIVEITGGATLIDATVAQTFTDAKKQKLSGPDIPVSASLITGQSNTDFTAGDRADFPRWPTTVEYLKRFPLIAQPGEYLRIASRALNPGTGVEGTLIWVEF